MRTPYLLLPALAFVALCLAASAHATQNPVSLAEANALAEPVAVTATRNRAGKPVTRGKARWTAFPGAPVTVLWPFLTDRERE